jgi:hypothetical protein
MVQPGRLRTKTSFNIAQALAPGQLRERQAQILIKARKALDRKRSFDRTLQRLL